MLYIKRLKNGEIQYSYKKTSVNDNNLSNISTPILIPKISKSKQLLRHKWYNDNYRIIDQVIDDIVLDTQYLIHPTCKVKFDYERMINDIKNFLHDTKF